ncbi:MAG: RluA family pseudouridine synthase [Alphaproteobacteria bacterium]|nr:RluA family pseudouridine synthase [Alphaproteobacteria bacterium]
MIKISIEEDCGKLNSFLKKKYPSLTLTHLQKLCRVGEIRINGKRVEYKAPLCAGDELKLPPFIVEYEAPRKISRFDTAQLDLILENILYQDSEIVVINKPEGLASQGGSKVLISADRLINEALGGEFRLVHRLDSETSGALVFAKNYNAAKEIADMFGRREVEKTYVALCLGNTERKSGTITRPIENKEGKAQKAETQYRVLDEAFGLFSIVEFKPLTGRMHQIRIHAKSIGMPIVGDAKYSLRGAMEKLEERLGFKLPRRMFLHAYKIAIPEKKIITAPMPKDFSAVMKPLGLAL